MRGAAGVLAALVLLAGCTAEAPRATAPVAAAAGPTVVFSASGPIAPGTSYSAASLRKALPGYEIRQVETAAEDRTVPVLAAFRDGFQVMQVAGSGDRVTAVFGVSEAVAGPNGERWGATMAANGTDVASCRVGRNLWAGMAVCRARGAPNVELVYAISQYRGDGDRLPPRDELAGAALERVVWHPAG